MDGPPSSGILGDSWFINLADRTDRLQRFIGANAAILPLHRFEAFRPDTLSRASLLEQGVIREANHYSHPALCCAASHLSLWRLAAATNRPITILEDDALLHRDFVRIAEALAAAQPDWDIILWGCCHWNPFVINMSGLLYSVQPRFMEKPDTVFARARQNPVETRLVRLHIASGTYSYTLSPTGAARLLAKSLPIGNDNAPAPKNGFIDWRNDGIDVEMSRHYADLNAYICMPHIAYLTASKSSIEGAARYNHA